MIQNVYFKILCLNKSYYFLGELNSRVDRHENIGHGKIGLNGFSYFMNDPLLNNKPIILETPGPNYANDFLKLYNLEDKNLNKKIIKPLLKFEKNSPLESWPKKSKKKKVNK